MSQTVNSKIIAVRPSDVALKTTDFVEKIISSILEAGEADIVGIGEGIFLACSAANMATEIAKVYLNDLCVGPVQTHGQQVTPAISIHLGQKQMGEYSKLAEIEEKAMKDLDEQTISVSRASTMDRLITVSLLKLARFEEVRIVAAGGSITDAVALAFRLGNGQISKDDVGTKLVNLYSIKMRNDPTKSIAAMSIYMQKGLSQIYSKRQSELFNRVEAGI